MKIIENQWKNGEKTMKKRLILLKTSTLTIKPLKPKSQVHQALEASNGDGLGLRLTASHACTPSCSTAAPPSCGWAAWPGSSAPCTSLFTNFLFI